MTRAGRWLRRIVEKWVGRYYEGPEPPKRIAEEVRLFRIMYPMAGIDEWETFTTNIAQNSYRDGFVRGFDWNERDWKGPDVEPELLAEAEAQDWSLAEQDPHFARMLEQAADPNDPLAGATPEQRLEFYRQLGAYRGTFRVVVEDPEE